LFSDVGALGGFTGADCASGGVACFADTAGGSGARGAGVDGAAGTVTGSGAVATGPGFVVDFDATSQDTMPRLMRITAAATQGQMWRGTDVAGRGLIVAVGALTCARSRSAFLSASRMYDMRVNFL